MSLSKEECKGRKETIHTGIKIKDEGRQMENKSSKEWSRRNLIEIVRQTMNKEDNGEKENKDRFET